MFKSRVSLFLVLAAAAVVAVTAAAAPAAVKAGTNPPQARTPQTERVDVKFQEGTTLRLPPAGAVPTTTEWKTLEARASRDGSVRVLAELDPGTTASTKGAQLALFAHARARLLSEFGGARQMRHLNAVAGSPIVAFAANVSDLAKLRTSKNVRSVVVDGIHDLAGTSSNGAQRGVQIANWWDYARMGADWANNNGYTGSGQRVVVIDTGVDRNHPWLSGHVATEACFATNTDGSGACPNGLTYDYSTSSAGVPGAAAYCTYSVECAHGTHVAHTAAGAYGVARGAGIVAIQASHREWSPALNAYAPVFNDSDLVNALWYVYYKLPFWPAAINISVGGDGYTSACDTRNPTLTSYINALKNAGVATVVASGNNDYYNAVSSPGCISNAITVGNSTLDPSGYDAVLGNVAFGSNSSTLVDVLAPGTDICSALPVSLDVTDGSQDGVGCDWFGTSMAAPHVAGAIAQIRQSRPTASVDQILSALQRRGTPILDTRNNITRSRINVANTIYYF